MKRFFQQYKRDLWIVLGLVAAAILCHSRYLLTPGLLFVTEGDSLRQQLPNAILMQKAILGGGMGWNWSFGLGGDLFTELTYAGSASPFTYLQSLFRLLTGDTGSGLLTALNWKLAFSMVKLSLSMGLMYALIRSNGRNRLHSALGALIYGCAPWFLYRAILFDFMTDAYVWLPLTGLAYNLYAKRGRWIPLCCAVALMAGANVYFGYISCIFYGLYILVASYEKGMGLGAYAAKTGKTVLVCLLGALLAAVALLPSVNALLSSDRTMGNAALSLLPDGETLSGFFELVFLGSGKLGLPLLLVLAVTVRFSDLTGEEKKRTVLAAFFLLSLLIPAMGSLMNGLSYPTPRWHFVVIFMAALAIPDWLAALERQGRVRPWHGLLLCGVSVGLYAVFGQLTATMAGLAWAAGFGLELGAVLLVSCRERLAGTRWMRFYGWALALCIALSGILNATSVRVFNVYEDTITELFYGSENQKAANEALAKLEETEGFFRTQDLDMDEKNGENRPYVSGVHGVSNYASELNGELSVWMKKDMAFRTSPICAAIYKSFDDRLFADIAWDVSYKVPGEGETVNLPSYYEKTELEDGTEVYRNTLSTGFDLWYDTVMPKAAWDELTYGEKDGALLQTAAVEGTKNSYPAPRLDEATTLLYAGLSQAGITGGTLENGLLTVEDTAVIAFPLPNETEEGEYLLELWISETSGEERFTMTANGAPLEKFADALSSESLNYPLDTYAFRFPAGGPVELTLSRGVYEIRNCILSFHTYRYVEAWTEARNAYNITDLTIRGGRITGRLDAEEPGILALSMHNAKGWRCKVDGKDVPLLTVNGIFPGIEISPGSHSIQLTYRTPWLLAGAVVSIAALAAIVLLARRGAHLQKREKML